MKKGIIACALAITAAFSASAVEKYEYNDYYWQRRSLFEQLPVTSNDIVFVGNSLTNNCYWGELFGNSDVKNRGIISDVIQGVTDRISLVTSGKPKKIFLMTGTNDISHDLTPESIASGMEKLLAKIKAESPSTQIYLQSILPINNSFGRYKKMVGKESVIVECNKLLKPLAEKMGATWIDLVPALSDEQGNLKAELTNDGLHVNEAGYRIWRNQIAQYIDDYWGDESDPTYDINTGDIVLIGNDLVHGGEWSELTDINTMKWRSTNDFLSSSLVSLAEKIAQCKPKRIVFVAPYNSADGNISKEAIFKTIDDVVNVIRSTSPSTEIVVNTLMPVNSTYKAYAGFAGKHGTIMQINYEILQYIKTKGINVVDPYKKLVDAKGNLKAEYTNDGFHLMGPAYKIWGAEISERIH